MNASNATRPIPGNKGTLIGQKPPLKLQEIWTLRTRLQLANKTRELALFDLALDSSFRAAGSTPTRTVHIARDNLAPVGEPNEDGAPECKQPPSPGPRWPIAPAGC